MERYRAQIDEILSKAGIDYRDAQDVGFGPGRIGDRLASWAEKNPNDPLAQKYRQNPAQFRDSLIFGVRRLRQGGEHENDDTLIGNLSPAATRLEAQGTSGQPVAPVLNTEEEKIAKERGDITNWIKTFTEEMSRDLGPGDPMFDSLSKLGAARASMGVGQSGIRVGRGGLGELAIQQGAQNAVMPYQMQRKQMAQQGLGLLDQRDRGLESLRQGASQLGMMQTQMNNQLLEQQYGREADAAGGTGGFLGGLAGGAAGLIATAATGGAAAPAIPGLISGGASIGAGWGQQSVRRPTYQTARPYKFGSYA